MLPFRNTFPLIYTTVLYIAQWLTMWLQDSNHKDNHLFSHVFCLFFTINLEGKLYIKHTEHNLPLFWPSTSFHTVPKSVVIFKRTPCHKLGCAVWKNWVSNRQAELPKDAIQYWFSALACIMENVGSSIFGALPIKNRLRCWSDTLSKLSG